MNRTTRPPSPLSMYQGEGRRCVVFTGGGDYSLSHLGAGHADWLGERNARHRDEAEAGPARHRSTSRVELRGARGKRRAHEEPQRFEWDHGVGGTGGRRAVESKDAQSASGTRSISANNFMSSHSVKVLRLNQ